MSKPEFSHSYCFESYGVPVRIESNSAEILKKAITTANSALVDKVQPIDCTGSEQTFSLPITADGICSVIQNGESITFGEPNRNFWKYFDGLVRILVAEFTEKLVFLHSGVVGWRGKAILIPGNSFHGKTTLVAEFVKIGAEYYSDEYAILDEHGLVHPFERDLSMRPDDTFLTQTRVRVEELNGKVGITPIPVGVVLFTKFDRETVVNYQFLTPGQAVVRVVEHAISIRRNSEFAIKVLKNAFSSAIIIESPRSEADKFARDFLEFVDISAT
jgi:hypothetical protein